MFHHRTLFRVGLAMLLLGGFALVALGAGTEGKLAGVVSDAASGAPLPFANVTVLGSVLGSATAADGSFAILFVPAGTYSVQVSVPGYKTIVVDNVLITPDFTTNVEVKMEQTVAAVLEPVRVEATRPIIQRDATSTVRILDSEQYAKLPTRGYQDAASIQAGVVSSKGSGALDVAGNETQNNPVLFIRGGRANEVAYFVDGFSQQDPLTGYSTTSINTNAVDQVVVMTGGFNAEYGRIMSGAVNVVTKEGRPDYFGTVEAVTDNLAGDWIGTKKYDYNIYGASLGGPLLPGREDVTFFASGERRWQQDRAPRSIQDGVLPSNWLSGWTWQGKVSWRLTSALTLRGGTLGSNDDWREYVHSYLMTPDHMPRYEDRNNSFFGSVTHNLDKNTYYDLRVNYFQTERESGDNLYFDDLDGYRRVQIKPDTIVDPGNRALIDEYSLFWSPGNDTISSRAWDDYQHRKSSYVGFTGDFTRQWSEHNTAKLGADFQRHTLRFYQHLFPTQAWVGLDRQGYDDVVNYGFDRTGTSELDGKEGDYEDGAKHPVSASFYAQNKYEFNDFVLNAGLRYDYLDPKTETLVNPNLPLGEGGSTLGLADSEASNKISPRLGVGFPVSQSTLFHANYGKFFQQPNLQDLYTSYRYLEYKVRTGGYYFAFGNPNLEPEQSTAYEVGLTHAINPKVRLDVTAYYKDVQDLVQVQNQPSVPNNFSSYRNTDFGTIKGIDLNAQLLPVLGFSGSASYSLSYANGTGSISDSQRDIAWTSDETPKQTAPLAFDQRHKVTLNVDYSTGKEAGPMVGGFRPFERSGINLLFNAASGFPYTPIFLQNEATLAASSETPTGPVNSKYGPWTYQMDMKYTRAFPLMGYDLEAFVWVLNLFDRDNALQVYRGTGSASTTGWLATEEGRKWSADYGAAGVAAYQLKERDPRFYGIPRMVRFGLKTSF